MKRSKNGWATVSIDWTTADGKDWVVTGKVDPSADEPGSTAAHITSVKRNSSQRDLEVEAWLARQAVNEEDVCLALCRDFMESAIDRNEMLYDDEMQHRVDAHLDHQRGY